MTAPEPGSEPPRPVPPPDQTPLTDQTPPPDQIPPPQAETVPVAILPGHPPQPGAPGFVQTGVPLMNDLGTAPPAPRAPTWWAGVVAAVLLAAAAALAVVSSVIPLFGGSSEWDDMRDLGLDRSGDPELEGSAEVDVSIAPFDPSFDVPQPDMYPLDDTLWTGLGMTPASLSGPPPGTWVPVLLGVVLVLVAGALAVLVATRVVAGAATAARITAAAGTGVLLSAAFVALQAVLSTKSQFDEMFGVPYEDTSDRMFMPELWVGPATVVLGVAALVAVLGMALTWVPIRKPVAFVPTAPGPIPQGPVTPGPIPQG
ncbi:hypothetical protein [Actinokineospora globicatena]|uniref:hypothetical protein n=1 Tax=Actinokineospora globicatena TaxID=103729 RepID=UPI002556D8E3|nr:hypothetical protein [Actinokineospora globicatena]